MDDLALARAVHVVAVVHWIGGVAFVTTIILPAVADPARRLAWFQEVEARFSRQVKLSVPLAGASGIYMVERMDLWSRFLEPANWWLAAMALLWLLFMTILFLVEPLVARGRHRDRFMASPDRTLAIVRRVHWLLLTASVVVAASAVLGSHGFFA